MIFYLSNYSVGFYSGWLRHETDSRNRYAHQAFIHSLVRPPSTKAPTPKSISVLTRAVLKPRVPTHIRQPAWRAGRWKSLT